VRAVPGGCRNRAANGRKCIKISHVKIQNVRKFHVFACNENKAYLSSARSAIALRLIET